MHWESESEQKFRKMIARIPVFHRRITEEAVTQRAEELAGARGAACVQEEDIIAAFFTDVPSPFYSMMIRLLDQSGFDYRAYGYPKTDARGGQA